MCVDYVGGSSDEPHADRLPVGLLAFRRTLTLSACAVRKGLWPTTRSRCRRARSARQRLETCRSAASSRLPDAAVFLRTLYSLSPKPHRRTSAARRGRARLPVRAMGFPRRLSPRGYGGACAHPSGLVRRPARPRTRGSLLGRVPFLCYVSHLLDVRRRPPRRRIMETVGLLAARSGIRPCPSAPPSRSPLYPSVAFAIRRRSWPIPA